MANLGELLAQGMQTGIKIKTTIDNIKEAKELENKYKTYGQMAQMVMEAPEEKRAFMWRYLYNQLPDDYKVGVSPNYDPNELQAFLAKSAAGYLYLQHKINQLNMGYRQAGTKELLSRAYLEEMRAYCLTHQNDPRCNYVLAAGESRTPKTWGERLKEMLYDYGKLKLKANKLQNTSLQTALQWDVTTWKDIDPTLYNLLIKAYEYRKEALGKGMDIEPEFAFGLALKDITGSQREGEQPQSFQPSQGENVNSVFNPSQVGNAISNMFNQGGTQK